jgi:hypothetical protein
MLVQAPIKFTTVASYISTYAFGQNMHGCMRADGTTSVFLMSPNFNFTNCGTTGCFGNMQEGYYGQNNLTDFSIYQGGYNALAPASGIYLVNSGTQSIVSDVYIEGNFNNSNVGGFTGSIFMDLNDIQCYQVGGICLAPGSGTVIILRGALNYLAGNDAVDLGSGQFSSVGYTQYVGNGGADVRFNSTNMAFSDNGGSFGTAAAVALYIGATGVTIDLQDDGLQSSTTAQGVIDYTTGTSTVSARNVQFTQTSATGYIFDVAGGTAVFNDLGGNKFTAAGSAITGTLNVSRSFSADSVSLATSNVGLTSGWSSSTVTAVGAQSNSHIGSFTITAAGTPGAGPQVTLTFPTAYPLVAPSACTFTQIGGTFAVLTNPVSGTPGKTTVTMTLTGTAVAAQTYTYSYNCGP